MKKIIIISLVVLAIVVSAFLALNSSNEPSRNNEGLRRSDIVSCEPSVSLIAIIK
jgi:hypothetical protein